MQSASPKVLDVLELLGLSFLELPQHFTEEEFEQLLKKRRDYEAVEEKIKILREQSRMLYKKYVLNEKEIF